MLIFQRTLKQKTCVLSGPGVHSGKTTSLVCHPAPPQSGIRFHLVDRGDSAHLPAILDHTLSSDSLRRTILRHPDGWTIQTPEHLLSACGALGITNLTVEVQGSEEIPILDGSALPYVQAFQDSGLLDQNDAPAPLWTVTEPFSFRHGDAEIAALPSDSAESLTIACYLDFPNTILDRQGIVLSINPETYSREVAPARTFALESDIEALRKNGLIQGGSLEIAVVVGRDRYLNPDLRFPDECARHKVIDLLGDLVLVGGLPRGHFMTFRAGHLSHLAFGHTLRKEHRIRWIQNPPTPLSR